MIHKINEPKFEPEMHDSRNQTGKRPPPLPIPPESQQPLQQRSQSPSQYNTTSEASVPSAVPSFPNLAATTQSYSQLPTQAPFVPSVFSQALGIPVNPFTQSSHLSHHLQHRENTTPKPHHHKKDDYNMMKASYMSADKLPKAPIASDMTSSASASRFVLLIYFFLSFTLCLLRHQIPFVYEYSDRWTIINNPESLKTIYQVVSLSQSCKPLIVAFLLTLHMNCINHTV